MKEKNAYIELILNKNFKLIYIYKGAVSKRKLKNNVKNYIFELFKILQCKTGNEFKKSHLFEPLGEFLTFP